MNPDDAVQWALYDPAQIAWRDVPAAARTGSAAAGFERLRAGDATAALQAFQTGGAGDIWSRIGASMAHLAAGLTERARQVLADDSGVVDDAAVERRAQLAATALATGDIAAARREIDLALAVQPHRDGDRRITLALDVGRVGIHRHVQSRVWARIEADTR